MTKAIYFDMDGTIANFYGVDGWLDYLINEDATPYEVARPLMRFATFARILNRLQKEGYHIGIVSWLAKNSTEGFDKAVTKTKLKWLKKHLPSVHFNEVHIVKYGTPKETVVKHPQGILFDDEDRNRKNWKGKAFDVDNIIETLKTI